MSSFADLCFTTYLDLYLCCHLCPREEAVFRSAEELGAGVPALIHFSSQGGEELVTSSQGSHQVVGPEQSLGGL